MPKIALLSLSLIAVIYLLNTLYCDLFSISYLEKPEIILIKPGDTLNKIFFKINTVHPINYPNLLKIILKLSFKESKLQFGEYIIENKSSLYSILKKLYLGNTLTRQILIAPGMTNYQIKHKILQDDSFTGIIPDDLLEGSLLPDTYYYKYGDTRISLIRRMQENAHKNYFKIWNESEKKDSSPIKSIEEAIILASIIEKESENYSDMEKISGVFNNRLKKKMKLQSDPTIIYDISNKTGILNRKLTKKDTKIPSDFNTYYIRGLPPTPIANPSIKAFFYAVNPLETEYLYFVANKQGKHYFSKTLEEHNRYIKLVKSSPN